jgi:dephospho-CoA kinase
MGNMSIVIAVSGLAGAGKTTSTEFMESEGLGQRFYVGQLVLDEVEARCLPAGAESENAIRLEIRDKFGTAAMAKLAAPRIIEMLQSKQNVLLDAVLSLEEFLYYTKECEIAVTLLMIEASFEIRSFRLAQRRDRKLTADELRTRDMLENQALGIERLLPTARKRIANDGTLEELHVQLREIRTIC